MLPQCVSGLGGLLFVPVALEPGLQARSSASEKTHSERDLIRVRCRPGDDALEFRDVILYRTDLHELFFNNLRVSHVPNLA